MPSTLVHPLLLPEIIATLATFLDRQDLIRCLRVCSLWQRFLEPELYREFNLPKKYAHRNRTKRRRRRAALRKEQEILTIADPAFAPPLPSGNPLAPHLQQEQECRYRRISAGTLRRNSNHIRTLHCTHLSMIEYLAPHCTRLEKLLLSQRLNLKIPFLLSMNATSLRSIHFSGCRMNGSVISTGRGQQAPNEQMKEYQTSLWTIFKIMAEQLFGLEELKLGQLELYGQTPVAAYVLTVFARLRVLDLHPQSLMLGWPWQPHSLGTDFKEGSPSPEPMPKLRSLSLVLGAHSSEFLLGVCPNLTSFKWYGFGLNVTQVKLQTDRMLGLLMEIKTLERIEFNHAATVSDDQWRQIVEALPRLRALSVERTKFGPLACYAVARRENEFRRNKLRNRRFSHSAAGRLEGPAAFEELNLRNCMNVTSQEMVLLLWFCNELKVLRGTHLEERAMTWGCVKMMCGSSTEPEDWLWPSSRTLQHLELILIHNTLPPNEREQPLIDLWSPQASLLISERLNDIKEAQEKPDQPSMDMLDEEFIQMTITRHQFRSLSNLESLRTNYWTLARAYRPSTNNLSHDTKEQIPHPRLRSVVVENWPKTARLNQKDQLLKDWLLKVAPSLRLITCANRPVWELEPPAFDDGLLSTQ
ncbi:hypothetical protein EMPS_00213 [Entomortierella parvispora]|uniref:F-box domain-containing protein n=1 Tax=Entomortierella parvispora TaxID=205924 RepID=A0A9P3LRN3_9FUNG|nr:hypothetical protein EMPS_00213 [Entomortierella parvispora]